MSRFLDARYGGLLPYTPGEQPQDRQYVKLNTNESPFPPSPMAEAAMRGEWAQRLNLYSDPESALLNRAIARRYGLGEANVVTGNGSDELLAFAFLAFCGKAKPAVFPAISYGFYPVFAQLCCIGARRIPLRADFSVDPEDYYNAEGTVVIANPNAPTGMALPRDGIEAILRHNRENVVVVDEAYVDFGAQSAVPLIAKYDNLLVVQTFSKSRNLAGMRLGFAMGNGELIRDMNTVRFSFNPYNVSRMGQLAGAAAMEDEAYFLQCTGRIRAVRERTAAALAAQGFEVLPSMANFVFARHPAISGEAYYLALREKGILVRHFTSQDIREFVRITVGTQEQMDGLTDKTKEILEEAK